MRLRTRFAVFTSGLILVGLASACAQFPELDGEISQNAAEKPYPKLLPVETLHMSTPEPRITPETGADIQTRVDALQRRADAIRGPVIDPATRQRMEAGVSH